MKNLSFLILVSAVAFLFSCQSKSGRLVEKRKAKSDSIETVRRINLKDSLSAVREKAKIDSFYQEQTFLSGIVYLSGKEGEAEPCLNFRFRKNSDCYIIFDVISSNSIEGSDDNHVPVDVALKIRDIFKKNLKNQHEFNFWGDGLIEIGLFSVCEKDIDYLSEAIILLKALDAETGWKTVKSSWKISSY